MQNDRFNFVAANYENYRKATEEFASFEIKLLEVLRSTAEMSLGYPAARSSSVSWRSHGRAYCIYPLEKSEVNLTFLVTPGGKIELKLYTDEEFRKGLQNFDEETPFKARLTENEKLGGSMMQVRSSHYLEFSEAIQTFANTLTFMAKRG